MATNAFQLVQGSLGKHNPPGKQQNYDGADGSREVAIDMFDV